MATQKYKSFAQALDLKNDKELIDEYKRLHKTVWPQVIDSLKKIGILKMKIFLIGNHLFMYYETIPTFSSSNYQSYTSDPKCQEWDLLMRKFQQKVAEAKVTDQWWADMEKVFDLNPEEEN